MSEGNIYAITVKEFGDKLYYFAHNAYESWLNSGLFEGILMLFGFLVLLGVVIVFLLVIMEWVHANVLH